MEMRAPALLNQKGVTIIETMMSVALVAIMFYGVSSLISYVGQAQKVATTKTTMLNLRQNWVSLMSNQDAWEATIANNVAAHPLMRCILPNDPNYGRCSDGDIERNIALYNPGGQVAFQGGANQGFDQRGNPCTTFNPTPGSGDDQCPFHIQLDWRISCTSKRPDGFCVTPQSLISGTFAYNPADPKMGTQVNVSSLALIVNRVDIPDSTGTALSNSQYCAQKPTAGTWKYLAVLPTTISANSSLVTNDGCVPIWVF